MRYYLNTKNKLTNKKQIPKQVPLSGFSLVETLISVALFTFVTLISVAILYSTQVLNNRLRATKYIYDNINLVLDDISREIRQGHGYMQSSTDNIRFVPYLNPSVSNQEYIYQKNGGKIEKKIINVDKNRNELSQLKIEQMTSDTVKIKNFFINIVGDQTYSNVGDIRQPLVTVIIEGETTVKPIVPFRIETIISQRDLDN